MQEHNVWVISDTHYNHNKLCELAGRPQNFTKQIIDNWNRVVGDQDLVIHLGDVILGRNSELGQINAKLKGKKVLVRGNHDHKGLNYYMQNGFIFACDGFRWDNIWFTHQPALCLPSDCQYNVHGHLHNDGLHIDAIGQPLRDWHYLVEIETTLSPVPLCQVKAGFTQHKTE